MRPRCYVCCPAYAVHGPIDRDRIVHSIKRFTDHAGYELVLSPLLDQHLGHGAWLPEAERIADIKRALGHEMIWAARGGYGSVHLVDAVLGERVERAPILIGYSDLTILHACWRKRGWRESLYGSIPSQIEGSRGGETLAKALLGEGFVRDESTDRAVQVLRPGEARGTLAVACLSVLAGLCGTPAQPDLSGCILAIEDVDERAFMIDSALQQLRRAGVLDGVVGLVGGSFTNQEKPDYAGPSVTDVLRAWGKALAIPTLARLPFGHLNDGLILPWGRATVLRAQGDGDWSLTISARSKRA
ncbi:MAG TPA: LD-carboxypeptidase [Planctomycetota bacterium]|nr:LD-carboxypeptidase [Planctomycetota bacterium]